MFDGVAFGREMVGIVRGYVERSLAPLSKRLDELEGRSIGITEDAARQMVADAVSKAIAERPAPSAPAEQWRPTEDELRSLLQPMVDALPKPENGKSVTVADVAPMISEEVQKAIAALPAIGPIQPTDDHLRSLILPILDALPKPQDGKSVTAEDVAPLIAEEARKAVAELPAIEPIQPTDDHLRSLIAPIIDALPKAKDGKSVTTEDVAPIIADLVKNAVASLPAAKDGVGLAGALIDREGQLVVTLTNGSTKELGIVVGRDVDQAAVEARIKELFDAVPKAHDGVDGLGFDDMTAEYDGERGIVLRFVRGEQVKEFAFTLPVVIDRGVWVEGKEYAAGDAVTWGGSLWIAQKDGAADKPDGGDGWRLAVKRGRDGKPGKDGELKALQPVKVS